MKAPASKIDDSVKIPAAVAAAAARADELQRMARGDQPEDNGGGSVTQQGNDDPEGKGDETVTQQGNPQSAPEPAKQAKPADPAKAEDGESWEHKYKSIHGRLQRQNQMVTQLTDEVRNLQNVIAALQAAPKSEAPAEPELNPEALLTPEEINDYGMDFLSVVGKKARQELEPFLKKQQEYIAKLEERLAGTEQVTAQSQHDRMKTTMDQELPSWRQLNTDPEFLDWLSLPDPFSGDIRHNMLKAAYSQGDARRVLAFFNGFLAQEAAVAPVSREPDTGTSRVPKVPLAELAAPGRAKTAATTSTPAEKPIINRDQISAFYADVAAGKYRGRDADKKATEEQIFAAQREGRIR